ncbi:hypothetical protein CsSME_00019160 [Camellia sinensis var. sinensis]
MLSQISHLTLSSISFQDSQSKPSSIAATFANSGSL